MKPMTRMLQDIEREVDLTRSLIGRDALNPRVMGAMKKVPRHEFVPAGAERYAYDNGPLAIGHGQTISQPYIVALMTDLLNPAADHVVLEVGTGSGYQAAILSLLVRQVYSLEIVEPLAVVARERLQRLGYTNVEVRNADGYHGWAEHAPFDGIVVTAAAPFIPNPLIEQLKPGGRLVIPVGLPYSHQELMLVEKTTDNEIRTRDVLGVVFVPLTGEHEVSPSEKPT
jgi:protein-L-isoaspartate(D-aspartate) O-methyltransferase